MKQTNTKTQGKTPDTMDNQPENKEKILRVMTGALSVLSYTPIARITYKHPDFNLMFASITKGLNYSPL